MGIAIPLAAALFFAAQSPTTLEEGTYPLDSTPREVPRTGRLPCPPIRTVAYRGEVVRYARVVHVHPAFKQQLRAFEKVVKDTAIEVYGKPPLKIRHAGAYSCRRMKQYPDFLSEHALGNAIDVLGFEFSNFTVTVVKHWSSQAKTDVAHARFLRLLAERLIARTEIFRVLLGPAYPGHKDHFHFDVAPYRVVSIFDEDES